MQIDSPSRKLLVVGALLLPESVSLFALNLDVVLLLTLSSAESNKLTNLVLREKLTEIERFPQPILTWSLMG